MQKFPRVVPNFKEENGKDGNIILEKRKDQFRPVKKEKLKVMSS